MITHKAVLVKEVLAHLPASAEIIIDGTLWHGGHSKAIAERYANQNIKINLIGLDIDPHIFQKTSTQLETIQNITTIQKSYTQIDEVISPESADFVLIDIGVNLEHFKDATRGFSTKQNGKLDMRFDTGQKLNAHVLINTYSPHQLSEIFQKYGEFHHKKADELAQLIYKTRQTSPIDDTQTLKSIFKECWLWEKASAVIFQAIRIKVNNELGNLELFLQKLPKILKNWWRSAIITFHSLEDRIVKNKFKQLAESWRKLLHKKAIKPTYQEVQANKASRSATLRVIQKQTTL